MKSFSYGIPALAGVAGLKKAEYEAFSSLFSQETWPRFHPGDTLRSDPDQTQPMDPTAFIQASCSHPSSMENLLIPSPSLPPQRLQEQEVESSLEKRAM